MEILDQIFSMEASIACGRWRQAQEVLLSVCAAYNLDIEIFEALVLVQTQINEMEKDDPQDEHICAKVMAALQETKKPKPMTKAQKHEFGEQLETILQAKQVRRPNQAH